MDSLPLVEFFTVSGFLFWIVTALAIGLSFIALSDDMLGLGVIATCGYIVAMTLFGPGAYAINAALANPWWLAAGAVAYLAVGVLYALFRWDRLCVVKRREYESEKLRWLASRIPEQVTVGIPAIPEHLKSEWARHVGGLGQVIPSPLRSKPEITTWLALWPLSGLAYLFSDVLAELFASLREAITGTLKRIAAARFRGLADDLPSDSAK